MDNIISEFDPKDTLLKAIDLAKTVHEIEQEAKKYIEDKKAKNKNQ